MVGMNCRPEYHQHKDENSGRDFRSVAPDQQYIAEKGSVQGPTLEERHKVLTSALTRPTHNGRTVRGRADMT